MENEENVHKCECGKLFVTEKGLQVHRHTCSEARDNEVPINQHGKGNDTITEDQCKEFRQSVLKGEVPPDIADGVGVSDCTVYYHVRGKCQHKINQSSLEWELGEGWVEK